MFLVDLQDFLDTRAECLQVDALERFLLLVLLVILVTWAAADRAADLTLGLVVTWLVVLFVRKLECQF